ncbi:MAG: glycosyltransferase family 2 protein [Muribaculaceae bacterium]|nr:glycosyltransferase family 2 protein [Muribaculaceae bacterium]
MRVSVLVPVYGVEKYIERCAVSLFEQSYQDIEYIFVDDCSPDNSIAILESVIAKYPRRSNAIRILRHNENKGSGAVRNTALNAATGEAIFFVDSDDYITTNAVETLCNTMEESDADIVDAGFDTIKGGKLQASQMPYHGSNDKYLKLMLCQNLVSNRLWGRLIKRDLFVKHNIGFKLGIDYGEDFSVVPRLLYYGKRTTANHVVYHYNNDNNTSYTNNISLKNIKSFINANSVVFNFFKQIDDSKRYSTPTDIGIVNVYRFIRRFDTDNQLENDTFSLKPNGAIWKFYARLYQKHFPLGITDFFYRMSRGISKLRF